jgi:hypothetical protein
MVSNIMREHMVVLMISRGNSCPSHFSEEDILTFMLVRFTEVMLLLLLLP